MKEVHGVNRFEIRGKSEPFELPRYDARALIPDGQTARIVLNGQVYTLRTMRGEKLILTK